MSMEQSAPSVRFPGIKRCPAQHSSVFSSNACPQQCVPKDTAPRDASCCGRPVSNLERFLEHTTPRVASQFFSKTRMRNLSLKGCLASSRHFFSLGDLWDSFDEWSAYGAGVPIVLNGQETVIQYYVPYLSAIQLYTSSTSEIFSRRLGDDSDGSEIDFRDTSSEGSSDGETEKLLGQDSWTSSGHGARGSLEVGDVLTEEEQLWQEEDKPESLVYEYFETAAPSLRIPLYDKIRELALRLPALKTSRSNDLSRSSWLSVAWYPIYRIPTGLTLKDLAACFLTYHSLSTLLPGHTKEIHGIHTQELNLTPESLVALHPFGLASYKYRGAIWTPAGGADHHYAITLQHSSDGWLKQLHVRHPDFEYFMSRCPSLRH